MILQRESVFFSHGEEKKSTEPPSERLSLLSIGKNHFT